MRIALIVSTFPSVSETSVVRRVTELRDRGWDIHVVPTTTSSDAWRWFPEIATDLDLRERVYPRPRTFGHNGGRWRVAVLFPVLLLATLLRAPRRTLRYLVRGGRTHGRGVVTRFVQDSPLIALGPDVVHFEFGSLAIGRETTGRLLGCPSVVSFQGYDINYVGLDHDPGYYDELWRSVDAVHLVSEDLLRRAKTRGLPAKLPSFVVPNGVEKGWYEAPARKHSDVVGTPGRPLRLLSVGRLHWKKGYEYGLAAVRDLIDAGISCEYRIVGDGAFREAILFTRDDLGLTDDVSLLGALPSADIHEQMKWADVFWHPAVSEGFCVAATEAQASALPVVTTDADGLAENIEHGVTGFVVRRRDPAAASRRIAELAADPTLRDRFGQQGVLRVRTRFSLDAHVDGIEEIYRVIGR